MKTLLISLLLIGSIASAAAQSEQRESIVWTTNTLPPYIITEGETKGQGILDRARNLIVNRFPQIDFEFVVAKNPRIYEMLKSKPNVCNGILLRNREREEIADFTHNSMLKILPAGVITTRDGRKELTPFINANGELRLDAALASKKHRLALQRARSHGAAIDEITQRPALADALHFMDNIPPESGLLKLMHQREFDMMMGYALELKSTSMNSKFNEGDFAFLAVAGASELLPIPVACSKSPAGKQFLAAVDKILAEPAYQKEITQLYRGWLDAETALRYDRLIKQTTAAR